LWIEAASETIHCRRLEATPKHQQRRREFFSVSTSKIKELKKKQTESE